MVLDFNTLYSPFDRFDKLFEEFLSPGVAGRKSMAYPPLNLSQDDDTIYVRAEIPGVDMSGIELTLTDKTLVLKGERKAEEGKYYRQERPAGVFHRVINLNIPVQRDKVNATMKDGLLTVALPKAEEVKPRTISIDVK
ncbi:Hsp20/alpha crystallin family protein [Pseudodesulfovibrio senegalensis]|jgi:HSP20 family protein|uniref:Hsp20/alpha crystallin family protein n=1 Tax=Pseudodesulfovibrio senegalensis TaxID=1721087 RepID=A0A6N6N0K5_9BACT|nr:Hsp20/alpha crystallin family protein [Pseudodesulfovibrio senegalensis]KAB1440908.1 Hsp20/alpha crystallin family protein [Pseudodesulfovibrio senegalensis]